MARFPPAPRLRRAGARQTERSGGHPIAIPRLRSGCYGARKFLFTPLGKRSFSFGARPRFPPPLNFVPTKLAHRLKLRLTDFVVFRQIFSYLSNNPPHSTTVKPFLSGVIMFGCSRMICDSSGLK